MTRCRLRFLTFVVLLILSVASTSCDWRGANTLPLPGTKGGGPGSYVIRAQLPEVTNIQQNSRVRVGDVTVGNVTKVERQGWHALLTIRIAGDVDLPGNCTVKIGQTSLLGSLHIELAPPSDAPPTGKLGDGSLIPLSHAGSYPTTEQTLATVATLLNGGGLGQVQDITEAFATAFDGRTQDLRSLIGQLDTFVGHVDDQTNEIISATESFDSLVAKFAAEAPVLDRALETIPDALAVLEDNRRHLGDALDGMGKLSALTADAVNQTKQQLVNEVNAVGPVLESLANAGPDMTRALSVLATYPWPNETLDNWIRGDYGNATGVFDLTLSRMDQALLTGTRFEGRLTELEMQWGRTIGQFPSPATTGNPLVVPYRLEQGP